jgi:hypothetical protein
MLLNKHADNFLVMEILFICLIITTTDYSTPAVTKQENYSHITVHGFCTEAVGQIRRCGNTAVFQSQVKSKELSGLGSMFVYFSKI